MSEEQKKLWKEMIEEMKELRNDWIYEDWGSPEMIKHDEMFLAVDKELKRLWSVEGKGE